MLAESAVITAPHGRNTRPLVQSWGPVLCAVILAPFANGVHAVAAAAWLFPVYLLRFVRIQPATVEFPIVYVVLTGAFTFQFWGTAQLPPIAFA